MSFFSSLINFYQRTAAKRMFAHWSPAYEEEVIENAYSAADEVAKSAIKYLAKSAVQTPAIVDVGIGTGLLAQQLFDTMPCRITGLDFVDDMMAQCAARDITELLIKCDAGRDPWPLEPNSHDAVVAAGLFEYLTGDMARHFFKEAGECLKSSGLLILSYVPSEAGSQKINFWHGHSGTYLVCRYSPEEMEALFVRNGFIVLEHSLPFKGSVFQDGSSYEYRLIAAQKN